MNFWPFYSKPTDKKVQAYEEGGRWYLRLEFDVQDADDSRRVVHYDVPKIVLPQIEECEIVTIGPKIRSDHLAIVIRDGHILIENVDNPIIGGKPVGIISTRKFKEQKEMTLSEIEEELGHGVILKEEKGVERN